MKTLEWPLAYLPTANLAGRFPLADVNFATRYFSRNHALHLHRYRAAMHLAGATVEIMPGDITISPADLPSSYSLNRPGVHWCIHFEPADKADDKKLALPLHVSLGHATTAGEERFAHIGRLVSSGSARDRARASLALQELLLWIGDLSLMPGPRETICERAAALIDESFHETLTVPAIAETLGASQAHLARSFRKRFGMTMQRRLLGRRVTHARYLLESTDLPIWLVAERVGIPDPQHFNKSVRKVLGTSPSAIRLHAAAAEPIDPDR